MVRRYSARVNTHCVCCNPPRSIASSAHSPRTSWSKALSKSGANYMNSQLIKMEAILNGYAEGIALDINGYVSEGSGENLFIVRHGKLVTPPLGNSVLPGITRDSVLHLANEMKIPIAETMIPREMLYVADEVFFTGTAAEI